MPHKVLIIRPGKLQEFYQLRIILKCLILFQISDSENGAKAEGPFFIFL